MKSYIKSYRYRLSGLILTVGLAFFTVLLCSLIFGRRINALSGQLKKYQDSEYNFAYILNYGITEDNELIYADADIQLYSSERDNERLSVSCLMPEDDVKYTLSEWNEVSQLKSGEIILSRNVAKKYDLEIGDTVYAQYPYSSMRFPLVVSKIMGTEYDLDNPIISNEIGVVYVGYDRDYVESTNCRYILFSEKSQAEILSSYPQIIAGLINKNENYARVLNQGIPVLMFEVFFLFAAIALSSYFFFFDSFKALRCLFLKGESRHILTRIPLIERLVLWCLPCFLSVWVSIQFMPCNSELTKRFYAIPLIIGVFYAVILWIRDQIRLH